MTSVLEQWLRVAELNQTTSLISPRAWRRPPSFISSSVHTMTRLLQQSSTCRLCQAGMRRNYATAGSRKANASIDNKAASKMDRAKEVSANFCLALSVSSAQMWLTIPGDQLVYGQSYTDPAGLDATRLAQLKKVVPSLEAHETISRAWALHERNKREAFQHNMKVRFDAMQEALQELEVADPRLFQAATAPQSSLSQKHKGAEGLSASREGRLDGLFPRQIRVPTEASGDTVAWDADWKRPGGNQGALGSASPSTKGTA